MALPTHLLPTTVVGSYPQPDWLLNRQMLSKIVPRTRMQELWRIPAEFLEQAQDDATLLAIRDMERAGIDIITDGEMRRESYSNRFATALEGMDSANPGQVGPNVLALQRRRRPIRHEKSASPMGRRHPTLSTVEAVARAVSSWTKSTSRCRRSVSVCGSTP